MARVSDEYPNAPNTQAPPKAKVAGAPGQTNAAPSQTENPRPAIRTIQNPQTPKTAPDIVFGAARVAKSRPANPNIPSTAMIDSGEKLSAPGRKITKTPHSPTKIADHRRQPTVSPKKSAAPATTTIGVACKIAVADDKGVSTIAAVKKSRPMISKTLRTNIVRSITAWGNTDCPCARAKATKINDPPKPNQIIT